ncbi:MAG TPA: hypothetical protein VGZ93_02505 [Candidatus Methylacidiphilales bacterium]|nr:hypothetical protein [Candidatus Methylacidiphilales bacterium]
MSLIVLLTLVVMMFLAQSMSARQLSRGSLQQSKADQLAVSALDIVTGSLKQEIAAATNSTTVTFNTGPVSYSVYRPSSNASILPARSGNPAGVPDPIPNLVRRSWSGDSNLPFPSNASAVNSATDVSYNGRSITFARWNSHYLIPRPNGAADTDATPISGSGGFTAPDWVLVTDTGGPTVLASPNSSVIGRYAYAIYNEGGLLDVNVAGYPSNSTVAEYGDKPQLAYADLTQIGLAASDVDNLVGWRNYASVQPSGSFGSFSITTASQLQNFYNLITNNVTGFLSVNTATWNGLTDQAFINRQQLLQFRLREGFPATALQYLGTFSRDVAAPSWTPATPAGSTIDYASQKDAGASANRDVLDVRVTSTFMRADGTTAQIGEPLLKHRFPLNRLAGLSYSGINTTGTTTLLNGVPSVASAATIQRDFGLVWSTDHWNYCGPSGTTISSSIALLGSIGNREPNFFELLKAGILSGSLGRDAGSNGTYYVDWEEGPASGVQTSDQNIDFQVIQLGANIIDQSDTDSYPTEIHFADPNNSNAETPFYGIENLPYIQRIFARMLGNYTNASASPPQTGIAGWYMAELWNPHQNSGYTDTSSIPTQFRFIGSGPTAMFVPGPPVVNSTSIDLANSGYLQFTVNPITSPTLYRDPTLLTTGSVAPAPTVVSGTNGPDDAYGNGVLSGLYSGLIVPPSSNPSGGIQPQGCDLMLQYQTPSGTWKTYQLMKNLTGGHDWNPAVVNFYYQHADPRTDRFGTSLGQWTFGSPPTNPPGSSSSPQSIRPDTSPGWNGYDFFPRPSAGFIYPISSDGSIFDNFYIGTESDNVSTSNPAYTDPDGVMRSGEGYYASSNAGDGTDGRPMILGNTGSRPIILNRPFRNVGELGYAFRDDPWRNIDFMSPNTGDAGLLDLFCIQEEENTNGLVAGSVDLNTRQAPVLQAILAGAMKDETGVESPPAVPSADAATIANALVSWTTSANASEGPFLNRSELLTKASGVLVSGSSSSSDQQIKIRREAALRALSDVSTVRTWTLLIDLVAQTGHYPPGATTLAQFVVEGERRYWLHISIDRFTGQVVDRVLEPVYE